MQDAKYKDVRLTLGKNESVQVGSVRYTNKGRKRKRGRGARDDVVVVIRVTVDTSVFRIDNSDPDCKDISQSQS
jgi:hypothetical protein